MNHSWNDRIAGVTASVELKALEPCTDFTPSGRDAGPGGGRQGCLRPVDWITAGNAEEIDGERRPRGAISRKSRESVVGMRA